MDTLLYIGIAHTFFIVFFKLTKSQKNEGDFILIFWMIFLALPMVSDLVCPQGYDLPIPLLRDKLPYALTIGPFLLLYTNHITGGSKWTRGQYFIHFLPFVLGAVYKLLFVPELTFNPIIDRGNSRLGNLLSIALLTSSLTYVLITLKKLQCYKSDVLDQFSSLSEAISLKWLKWLAIGLVVISVQPFIFIFLSFPEVLHSRIFALLTFMYVLSFFGLKQLQVFHESVVDNENRYGGKLLNPEIKSLAVFDSHVGEGSVKSDATVQKHVADIVEECPNLTNQKEKYEHSGLTNKKAKELLHKLNVHMEKEQPHLDCGLTADKLAQQLQVPRYHLTQLFSEQLDKNFYLFINEHRIEAVKALMQDEEYHAVTLLEIAHRCGFNSKPTFNRVFKNSCGMTPSEYRKRFQNRASVTEDLQVFL